MMIATLSPYLDDFTFFFVAYMLMRVLMGSTFNMELIVEVAMASAIFSWVFNHMLNKNK